MFWNRQKFRLVAAISLLLVAGFLVTSFTSYFVSRASLRSEISLNTYQKRIETLRGIVPICSYCKQIRDDKGYWNRVEAYVAKHTEAKFSHSICPGCMEQHFPEEFELIKKKKTGDDGPGKEV